jgi:hypothetical protein
MQKVLLVQGLESMELAKLQLTGHKLIVINDENGGAVLQDILQGGKAESQAPLPKERVVIFHGYADTELRENLAKFKTLLKGRPIVAVVTEHSINWPYEYLLTEHLIKDRDENIKLETERRARLEKEAAEKTSRQ